MSSSRVKTTRSPSARGVSPGTSRLFTLTRSRGGGRAVQIRGAEVGTRTEGGAGRAGGSKRVACGKWQASERPVAQGVGGHGGSSPARVPLSAPSPEAGARIWMLPSRATTSPAVVPRGSCSMRPPGQTSTITSRGCFKGGAEARLRAAAWGARDPTAPAPQRRARLRQLSGQRGRGVGGVGAIQRGQRCGVGPGA